MKDDVGDLSELSRINEMLRYEKMIEEGIYFGPFRLGEPYIRNLQEN
jgi:hypothetical protein